MNWSSEKKKQIAWWIIGIAAACILLFLGVQNINVVTNAVSRIIGLILPLILGAFFALILNVPMQFFERHLWPKSKKPNLQKMRRPVSFFISLLVILGVLFGVIGLVIPSLIEAVAVIVQFVMDFINELNAMEKAEIAELPFGTLLLDTDWKEILNSMQTWIKEQSGVIVDTAFGTISSLIGGIANVFVSFFFSIYFLFNKDILCAQICRLVRAWLPKRFGEWCIHAAAVAGNNFRNFIAGQSLEALILGTLCMIGMLILGIPYAPMVGSLIGVTALIPVIGGFIGTVIGAFMILTVDPIKAIVFVVYLLVLQQFEGNLIYPRVMGSRVNLPGMWILAAVTIGGGIAGPIGMLIGVPIASTAYTLLKEATAMREEKLRKEEKQENAEIKDECM